MIFFVRILISFYLVLTFSIVNAQTDFSSKNIIWPTGASYTGGVRQIHTVDIDKDGDTDILMGYAFGQYHLGLLENLGGGVFDTLQLISGLSQRPTTIETSDFDNDGDIDIVVAIDAGTSNESLQWLENLGNGFFNSPQEISDQGDGIGFESILCVDLDLDNKEDILGSAIHIDNIYWYKNLGNGNFGNKQIISTLAVDAYSVFQPI